MANDLGIVSTPQVMAHPNGDIQWVRLLEGTSEILSREHAEARASYAVPYERRMDWLGVVMGAPTTPGGPWVTPWQYPDIPGIYAQDCSTEPRGLKGGSSMPYLCAKIDVVYKNPVYDYNDEVLYTLQYQGSASIITEPWGTLLWDDDSTYINVDGGRVVGQIAISLTRYRLVNIAAVNSLFDSFLIPSGKSLAVNNATFLGYPAGHVLFNTYSTTETATIFGAKDITATATLLFRSVPWNSGIKPATGAIIGVSYMDSSKPYIPMNFSALIS